MHDQRKYAILFAATILAARKLNEIGVKPCPAPECATSDAISNAELFSSALCASRWMRPTPHRRGPGARKHISTDFRTLQMEQKAKRGEIQDHLKTAAGKRQVDLCSSLAEMLEDHVGAHTGGLVFPSKMGKPPDQANIKLRSLHPILNHLTLPREIGLGFELPGAPVGQLGQLVQFQKAV